MDSLNAIQELFYDQVVPEITWVSVTWGDAAFSAAAQSDRVLDFKAWLRESLDEYQSRQLPHAATWVDLPSPIGDYANLDDIVEYFVYLLPEDHPLRWDWEHPNG